MDLVVGSWGRLDMPRAGSYWLVAREGVAKHSQETT